MTKLSASEPRRALFQFILCFYIANIVLTIIIGFNYLDVLPHFQALADSKPAATFIWVFLITSYFAQVILIFVPGFLFLALISLIVPRLLVVYVLSILLAMSLVFGFIADSITFHVYHMHYTEVGWKIFKVGAFSQVLSLSIDEIFWLLLAGIILFLIENIIAWNIWRYVNKGYSNRWIYVCLIVGVVFIVASYTLNFAARTLPDNYILTQNNRDLIVKATRFVPDYDELYQFIMPSYTEVRQIETPSGIVALRLKDDNRLGIFSSAQLNFPAFDQTIFHDVNQLRIKNHYFK